MLRTYLSGASDRRSSSSQHMANAAGGSTTERIPWSRDESGELVGIELRHEHDGRADAEREADVVDPGPERQRDRDQVRHRRGLACVAAARAPCRRRRRGAPSTWEWRNGHGTRRPGRPRRRLHERDVRVERLDRIVQQQPHALGRLDARQVAEPRHVGRRREDCTWRHRLEQARDLAIGQARVDGDVHRAGRPHAEQRGDHPGVVLEHRGDRISRADAERRPTRPGSRCARSIRSRARDVFAGSVDEHRVRVCPVRRRGGRRASSRVVARLERQPARLALLGERLRPFFLVGVPPHRDQLARAGATRVRQARPRAHPTARASSRPSPRGSSCAIFSPSSCAASRSRSGGSTISEIMPSS